MKHLQRQKCATPIAGLKKIARKVWRGITRKYFKNLYPSMPNRIQAVVDNAGSHTKALKTHPSLKFVLVIAGPTLSGQTIFMTNAVFVNVQSLFLIRINLSYATL